MAHRHEFVAGMDAVDRVTDYICFVFMMMMVDEGSVILIFRPVPMGFLELRVSTVSSLLFSSIFCIFMMVFHAGCPRMVPRLRGGNELSD